MIAIHLDDALLVVDIQNDFLPGGALGVPCGDEVVPVLLRYIKKFESKGNLIIVTRDWHPPNHCSFKPQGGIWPVHCVAGSAGAEHPASFPIPPSALNIQKGTDPDKEAYSAFHGTTLDAELKQAAVRRLFVGGLATDYCVLNTVRDALNHGYDVCILLDGIRAVNLCPEDGASAVEEMVQQGAIFINLEVLED
jgi:nicotinamidase/pyrazinamidase